MKNKTIKIKCLKADIKNRDGSTDFPEMVYFEGIERFLIDLWDEQGKNGWYEIIKED
jgi:hypothetical protein